MKKIKFGERMIWHKESNVFIFLKWSQNILQEVATKRMQQYYFVFFVCLGLPHNNKNCGTILHFFVTKNYLDILTHWPICSFNNIFGQDWGVLAGF